MCYDNSDGQNLSNLFLPPLITYLGRSVDPRRTLDFMALHQTFHKAYPDGADFSQNAPPHIGFAG